MNDRRERMRLVEPLWAALHPDDPEEQDPPDDDPPTGGAARRGLAVRAVLLPAACVRRLAGGLRRAARALGVARRRPAPPASPGDD